MTLEDVSHVCGIAAARSLSPPVGAYTPTKPCASAAKPAACERLIAQSLICMLTPFSD